jgi:hypothetical protein
MAARYVVTVAADAVLSAATAKTIVNVINAANALVRVTEIGVSFTGIAAAAAPVTVELMLSTQATAGTPGTSPTPTQVGGPTRTVQSGGAEDYSAEPTALTAIRKWLVHPQTGIIVQFPLGREPEQTTTADGICLRVTAPATVNCQGYIEFEEG